jgi:hypothetical protein
MVNLVILGDFYGISVAHDHWYVPLFVSNSRSFPHSWLITGFVAWVKRRVPVVEQELQHSKLIYGYFTGIIQRMALVEQELLNLRKQMGTPPFCPFSFGHCCLFFFDYGFWLPPSYLQTFLYLCVSIWTKTNITWNIMWCHRKNETLLIRTSIICLTIKDITINYCLIHPSKKNYMLTNGQPEAQP